MSEGNGKAAPEDEPFGGNGPINLSHAMRQQAWSMTALLAYQRRVRVLTERLQKLEMERETYK